MYDIPLSKGIAIALVVVGGMAAVLFYTSLHPPAFIRVINRVISKPVSARKDKAN
jgi:hypothetical protein